MRRIATEEPSSRRPVLVHVTTTAMMLYFLRGHPPFVRERLRWSVHAIAAPGDLLAHFAESQGVPVHAVPMARRITPLRDLGAVWRIWRVLRRVRPDVVHAHTPKGGLLGMIAAWLARVPVRIYHVHGLPLATATGLRASLLRASERTSCRLAHRVLCVSHSLRALVVDEGLCSAEKAKVLLSGSISGVDATRRFQPADAAGRAAARARYGLPPDALVVGFVGRLAREKGLAELAQAWAILREENPGLHLLVVGPPDDRDPVPDASLSAIRTDPRVGFTGLVEDVAEAYAAVDVVALPTYREGLGVVALEAAAMALPTVASAVPGCVDAVQDGVTGTLVPARDPVALANALRRYLRDAPLRARHGAAGRRRILAEFRREAVLEALAVEYEALLSAARAAASRARHPRRPRAGPAAAPGAAPAPSLVSRSIRPSSARRAGPPPPGERP